MKRTSGILISDSKNLFHRLSQTMLTLKIELLCLKETMVFNQGLMRWGNGDSQLSNSLTNNDAPHQLLLFHARHGRWRIVYDQSLVQVEKGKV